MSNLRKLGSTLLDENAALASELAAIHAENLRLKEALQGLEPYLDAIVCYASTMGEYEPNRIAHNARTALKGKGEGK